MFKCTVCNGSYNLPKCPSCGHSPVLTNNVWQLTNDPDILTGGDGDKYVGYEYIGDSYSGNRKYVLEHPNTVFANEISRLTSDGIFLDLGCGDGCFAVPAAQNGTRVIAADISNKMMGILQQKAHHNNVSLDNVTLCRMNALSVPLDDSTVDCVVSNSVLHLISRPEKVIEEIYRVLKSNGCFVFKDDRPGVVKESPYDNTKYLSAVRDIYNYYWEYLRTKGISPVKYSWKFDRDALCMNFFESREEVVLPINQEYENKLEDGFLPRLMCRGFSDQVEVDETSHELAISYAIEQAKNAYGLDFGKLVFRGVESDIIMTIYRK